MEDYKIEEVIEALKKLNKNSRQRSLVDQRSYLFGLLHQKFELSEQKIAVLTGFKRSRVNYARRMPIQFIADESYQQNVYVYAQLFPHDFRKSYAIKSHRHHTIKLVIDDKTGRKLKRIKGLLNHDNIKETVKHLLEKSLKLWEE
jgi:hypothetical protein